MNRIVQRATTTTTTATTRAIRTMKIQAVPMWWGSGNNYAYIVTDDATKDSIVVDPAEPKAVFQQLKELNDIKLVGILNTHHHHDHSGGNEAFNKQYPKVPIIAGKDSPLVTTTPKDGSTFKVGKDIHVTALHTPCHTQDSICYYVNDNGDKAVFTGDTLFTAGCGRFFEGTAKEMDKALNYTLANLPKDTKVYPGHEYTAGNVKFAKTILKDNKSLENLDQYTKNHKFTTGVFTIGDELNFNPFMRLSDPECENATGSNDKYQVMAQLRNAKNNM